MIKKLIKFIHNLRLIFFAFILFSFFYYLSANPVDLRRYIGAGFSSAVGMKMSVEENPVNKLALQLKEKEESLNQKEQELNQKEAELQNAATPANQKLMIIMLVGIVVLFFLIILNFALDYRRKKKLSKA